jgi:hypothetical protein
MPEQDTDKFINNRSDKDDGEAVDQEVQESLAEDQQLDYGSRQLKRRLAQHTDESPELSAGDVDAAWDKADDAGEEAVGGTTPTPDQDLVDEVGQAVGLTYSDTEPLHTDDKLSKREQDRWDLNPASDPEYEERIKEEFGKKKRKPDDKS